MKKILLILVVGLLIAVFFLYRDRVENTKLKKTIEELQSEQARSNAELKASRLALQQRPLAAAPAVSGDAPFEDALNVWLGKVQALASYLERNPRLKIPQMSRLNAEDWLDAVKDTPLATDADYRRALGKLRGLARQMVANDVGGALVQYLAANGGKPPSSAQDMAQFFPASDDPNVLGQLAMNPSGKIPGLGTGTNFILVDTPVDLWDSTLFYNTDGNWGVRQAMAPGEPYVVTAIAQFTKTNGWAPTDPSQLMSYNGISQIDTTVLQQVFDALTKKAD